MYITQSECTFCLKARQKEIDKQTICSGQRKGMEDLMDICCLCGQGFTCGISYLDPVWTDFTGFLVVIMCISL